MTALERITEWAALAEAATEGPWVWDEPSGNKWPSGEENLRNGAGEPVLSSWGYDADGIEASSEDRALIAASRIAVPAMAAALTAVLALHEWYCIGCEMSEPERCGPTCNHCYEEWPCPTVATVETALEASL